MEVDAADLVSIVCKGGAAGMLEIDAVEQEPDYLNWMRYWDDTNGKELKADLVQAARKEEIQEIRRMKFGTRCPETDASPRQAGRR